jgi:hypothetical protein
MKIKSPADLGRVWKATLDSITPSLRSSLLYVDLSNEWPIEPWTPFVPKGFRRATPEGERWMRESIAVCKAAHPDLPYTFSFTSEYDTWQKQDVSMLDFLELHIWMTHHGDFYNRVGYDYELWDSRGYDNLQLKGRSTYESDPAHWKSCLDYTINLATEWSKASGKPLITTECWGIVDYKDWPLLEWDWVKQLCEHGVRTSAATGRWVAMGTSNFCGPQFAGMWRDVAWHRRLTEVIHRAPVRV